MSQAPTANNNVHFTLQAPFCIHPKTGKLCVPIDLETAHKFNPDDVPSLSQMVAFAENLGNQVRLFSEC